MIKQTKARYITLRFDEQLAQRVEELARADKRTRSQFIRIVVEDFVARTSGKRTATANR